MDNLSNLYDFLPFLFSCQTNYIYTTIRFSYDLVAHKYPETFEKCQILFKIKEGENFNRRNTLSISRIKI